MSVQFDTVVVVFGLICLVHSVVLSSLILTLPKNDFKNGRLGLTLLLFVFSLRIGKSVLHLYYGDLFPTYAIFVSHSINFAIGPLLYLYYHDLERKSVMNRWVHFMPMVMVLISAPFLPINIWPYLYAILIIQTLIYLIAVVKQVDHLWDFSNTLDRWKSLLFMAVAIISMSYFVVVLFDWNQYLLPILTYSVLLYLMTLYLLKSSDIHELVEIREKYRSSKLSGTQKTAILNQLTALMDNNHLYKDSDLSLKKLSGRLGIQESYISQAINMDLATNFNGFINDYRVNSLCQALEQDRGQLMTIEQHAFAMGFNSLSTCYQVFKSKIGMTPKQFRDQKITK